MVKPSPPAGDGLRAVPAPTPDTVLQVAFPDEGRVERFLDDGRWVRVASDGSVTPLVPRNFYEPGQDRIGPGGLRRLGEALRAVDFFTLPEEVPNGWPADLQLPNGLGPVAPRTVVLTARNPAGGFHTVRVAGDPRLPPTFGPLAPLLQAIDREAWGGWMLE